MRKILSFLLLLLLFCGCSRVSDLSENTDSLNYSANYQLLEFSDSLKSACVHNERVYYIARSADTIGKYTVYSCKLDGSDLQEHTGYKDEIRKHTSALHAAYGSWREVDPSHIIPNGANGVIVLQHLQSLEHENENILHAFFLDSNGELINNIPFSDIAGNFQERITPLVDSSGNLYLCGEKLSVITPDGTQVFTNQPPINQRFKGVLTLKDGRVAVVTAGIESLRLYIINLETGKLELLGSLPQPGSAQGALTWYSGVEGYDLVCNTGMTLYGYILGSEIACEPIVNWLNCGVDGTSLLFLFKSPSDNGFLCLSEDGSYFDIHKGLTSTTNGKTILTLACLGDHEDITDAVLSFNRKSTTHRIQIIDYESQAINSFSTGLDLLTTEIISGNVPDLICTSGLNIDTYIQLNLLENLWPYIDNDLELGRGSLVLPYFEALSVDNQLFEVSSGFRIHSVAALPHIAGEKQGWSWDEYNNARSQLPNLMAVFDMSNSTQAQWLEDILLPIYLPQFLEENSFNTADFIDLLEFSNSLELNEDILQDGMDRLRELKLSAQVMLQLETYMRSPTDYAYATKYSYINAENSMIGFPGLTGNGSAFEAHVPIAMTTTCDDKDGAWQFLRTLLMPAGQPRPTQQAVNSNSSTYYFPSNKAVLDKLLNDYLHPLANDYGIIRQYRTISGEKVEIEPWDEEMITAFWDWINGIEVVTRTYPDVEAIILDEAILYFAGEQTVYTAANSIQNRVGIYLSEKSR